MNLGQRMRTADFLTNELTYFPTRFFHHDCVLYVKGNQITRKPRLYLLNGNWTLLYYYQSRFSKSSLVNDRAEAERCVGVPF